MAANFSKSKSIHTDISYVMTENDEIEDLFELIQDVKVRCRISGRWARSRAT